MVSNQRQIELFILDDSQEVSAHAEFTKDPQLGIIILFANLPPTDDANRHANAKA
jgi:hypothetical protein